MTGKTKIETTETATTKTDISKIKIGVSACLLGEKVVGVTFFRPVF